MKIFIPLLAMSLFLSNIGLSNDQLAFETAELNPNDETTDSMNTQEEERAIPAVVVGIISLIVGVVNLGCDAARNEGAALARRDPGARRTFNDNRTLIYAGAIAASPAFGYHIASCFEDGLF